MSPLKLKGDCAFSVAAQLYVDSFISFSGIRINDILLMCVFSCQFMYFIVRLYRTLVSSGCFECALKIKVPCIALMLTVSWITNSGRPFCGVITSLSVLFLTLETELIQQEMTRVLPELDNNKLQAVVNHLCFVVGVEKTQTGPFTSRGDISGLLIPYTK